MSLPGDVLESFLLDMEALDQQHQLFPSIDATAAPQICHSHAPKARDHALLPLKKKKSAQPSWIKRKQELQSLREQAQALETRVVFLERKKSASNGAINALKRAKLRNSASRENQKCQAAFKENERLRAKMQTYRSQASALQTAFTAVEAFQLSNLAAMEALRVEMGAGRQLGNYSSQVFDMLEGRVDARKHELESAFQAMQQPMASTDTDLVECYDSGVDCVEFSRLELLPYERDTISNTMWSLIGSGRFPDGELSVVSRRCKDGFGLSHRVTVQLDDGGVAIIDTHSVTKRFITSDGVATLAEACSTWTVNMPGTGTWSHSTREEGCFVMQNYSLDGDTSPGICQVRLTLCLHPGGYTDRSQGHPCVKEGAMKETVIPCFRQLVKARHQFVENALFDTFRCQ